MSLLKKFALGFCFLFLFAANIYSQQELIKYEPVEGNIIGIWPHENKLRSPEKLNELKDRFGFNYILVAAPYGEEWLTSVRKSKYDFDHVMKQLYYGDLVNRPEWFWKNVEATGKVWAYFFDEPISRDFPIIKILNLFTELSSKSYYPSAQFIMSEINEKKAKKLSRLVDVISYSGYGDKSKLGRDQIQSWIEWKDYLGEKFSMLWIAAHEDSSEFRTLLKAAKEQGYKNIWLYQYEPLEAEKEIGDEIIQRFCEAAVEYGFMKLK